MQRRIDALAVTAGAIRLASGVSFLVAPETANRIWGDSQETDATASLLLRSMGYRDALIGALLVWSGVRGDGTSARWFLASAGADAADLLGGIANHERMTAQQRARGLGGAAVGIGVGVLGAGARGACDACTWRSGVTALPIGVDIGTGPVIVMLPGFGMTPGLYRPTAELLARRCRVVVLDIYRVRGPWRHDDIVDRIAATIKELDCDARVTLIGHSFAGGVELGFATRFPEHVRELVFADTLAAAREVGLADEAMRHPVRLLWMATLAAAASFGSTVLTHPRQIAEAAWFGFRSGRGARDSERCVELGLRAHVLWANRDSILTQADGRAFANELDASFTVVKSPDGKPIDHDWIYRHPQLFVEHVEQLDLIALR